MNRVENPVEKLVPDFEYTRAQYLALDKGIGLHYVHAEDAIITRLQFVFDAGYAYQNKKLVANLCAKMLNKGTADMNAGEINDQLELYGAFWEAESLADKMMLTLHCLADKLEELLPLVGNLIQKSNFPENEMQQLLAISKQKYMVNNQKVAFIARQNFAEELFGTSHPYCNATKIEDFERIHRQDIVDFYRSHIQHQPFEIYGAACMNQATIECIERFVKALTIQEVQRRTSLDYSTKEEAIHHPVLREERNRFQQNAIRIGKIVPGRKEASFPDLYFTNVLLGGFFGSRLMRNIREDKGFTYGIHSGIVHHDYNSYLFIGTEVANEYVEDTLKEIQYELRRLQEEEVEEEEMVLVRNYLLGTMMRGFDGPFNAMDRYRTLSNMQYDYAYFDRLLLRIKEISPQEVMNTAKKQLNWEHMIKIVVGSK